MKPVLWWRKPEYPEETTDLRQVTDETFHTYGRTVLLAQKISYRTVLPALDIPNFGKLLFMLLAVNGIQLTFNLLSIHFVEAMAATDIAFAHLFLWLVGHWRHSITLPELPIKLVNLVIS